MFNAQQVLRDYISDVRRIRSTGQAVPETSYYGKMEVLFTAMGADLSPSIFCVLNTRNQGAGIPDGGLFAENQQDVRINTAGFGQPPARGVIEAKPPTQEDILKIANGTQVTRYLDEYGQVLVTNFYQFVLVTQDAMTKPHIGEVYSLAENEDAFWKDSIKSIVENHAEGLASFLQHVMMSAAPISEPRDLASILAFYAREAKLRIERGNIDTQRLNKIKTDFESALGITFEDSKGEQFFRSTLIQTLFYGIFSAWVLWHETPDAQNEGVEFNWHEASFLLHVPVIQGLFEQLSTATNVRKLNLETVLDWTEDALNRVNRDVFFEKFNSGEAIQYFYEPFLEAFDPDLREELGVWYTPTEVIEYMVERVDRVLREELNRPDGLADSSVYILDPAAGTGAYLVAVLERIYKTKLANYGEDAAKQAVKDAIQNIVGENPSGRVFGFEILPAPFVVAHLRLGLLLQQYGVPLQEDEERVGVYLTNSLSGWQPPEDKPRQLLIQALEQERDQADIIKRQRKILVVLGNPPYNAFSGTSTKEENITAKEGLVDKYKVGLRDKWGIKKYNLDDLYIRFFRIAERVIAEQNSEGIVSYISNFSYLNYPSFVVMRQELLKNFDKLWFDNMNGDSRETGKKTPDGKADPSVFSTDFNKSGIRKGTAIGLLVRKPIDERLDEPIVRYRDFWGVNKRADLLASLKKEDFDGNYELAQPRKENRYSLASWDVSNDYLGWAKLNDLALEGNQGLSEDRRKALIDSNKATLIARMKAYFNEDITWDEYIASNYHLTEDYVDFPAKETRINAINQAQFNEDNIQRYAMRPFDLQYCYYTNFGKLWRRERPEFYEQSWSGNAFLVSRRKAGKSDEQIPIGYINGLCDYHYLPPNATAFPIQLRKKLKKKDNQPSLFDQNETITKANLSNKARAFLTHLGISDADIDFENAALIWRHSLAIGYSPAYLEEHEEGIKNDFPRIPLPDSATLLRTSAKLGTQVADLLDTEKAVLSVTTGNIRDELRPVARQQGNDLAITARWGYQDSRDAVMPSSGDARERDYTDDERQAIEKGASALNIDLDTVLSLLGDTTYDIHLNDTTYWSNVPANVYEYRIGGYQVIKKWLSYRNADVLGRSLNGEEVMEVTQMARRITTIILLQPQLNTNYRDIKANLYEWSNAK